MGLSLCSGGGSVLIPARAALLRRRTVRVHRRDAGGVCRLTRFCNNIIIIICTYRRVWRVRVTARNTRRIVLASVCARLILLTRRRCATTMPDTMSFLNIIIRGLEWPPPLLSGREIITDRFRNTSELNRVSPLPPLVYDRSSAGADLRHCEPLSDLVGRQIFERQPNCIEY